MIETSSFENHMGAPKLPHTLRSIINQLGQSEAFHLFDKFDDDTIIPVVLLLVIGE